MNALLLDALWVLAELLSQLVGTCPALTVAVDVVDEDGWRISNLLLLARVTILEDLVHVDSHAILAALALHVILQHAQCLCQLRK